jgi:hypothetical protein
MIAVEPSHEKSFYHLRTFTVRVSIREYAALAMLLRINFELFQGRSIG